MQNDKFVLVGNWSFLPGPKGITVYRYNENDGSLEMVSNKFEEITAGQMFFDESTDILYSVDERGNRDGRTGGGGYIVSYKFDRKTADIKLMSKKEMLSPEPCYFWVDKSKKYALVASHGDSGHVTKISREEKKGFTAQTQFDDVALVLLRLEENGDIGEICDIAVIDGACDTVPPKIPHLHFVKADPTGELYIVCDKGLDRVYTFKIDREHGRLIHLKTIDALPGTSPRYGAFHPTLPVFYHDNEKQPIVTSYYYDIESGSLEKIGDTELLLEPVEGKKEGQDILIHPNGKYMYVSLSCVNYISVLEISSDGALKVIQNIESGGDFPRALTISPDEQFLLVGNMLSQNIITFAINKDGTLTNTENISKAVRPSVMKCIDTDDR